MNNKQVRFTTQIAMMLTLLVVIQYMTGSFGQMVTGSLVNMILLVTTFMVGIGGGITLAVVSPFLAHILGIGPAFIRIVVFVALGNGILVTLAWVLTHKTIDDTARLPYNGMSLVLAGIAKTAFLWIGLVKLALPLIPGLTPQQISVISSAFSWPQLITAGIGATLALIVMPILQRTVKK